MLTTLLSAATTGPSGGSQVTTYLLYGGMIIVLIAGFYFMMIRPQKKREKEESQMRSSLGVGDEITTTGGIVGRILSVADETVVIGTSGDCTKLRILKTSIARVDKKLGEAQVEETKK